MFTTVISPPLPLGRGTGVWRIVGVPSRAFKRRISGIGIQFKMADLLGSILSSMEKPPTVGDKESRRKARGINITIQYPATLCFVDAIIWPEQTERNHFFY